MHKKLKKTQQTVSQLGLQAMSLSLQLAKVQPLIFSPNAPPPT